MKLPTTFTAPGFPGATKCDLELQACIDPLQMAAKKCNGMLHANAFVHQYEKQGLEKGEIAAAMHRAIDVTEAYANM